METRLESLKRKIRGIEEQIEEQRKRIPPHSVKPAEIMELEALEEERDALAAEIRKIEGDLRPH
jgi:predicted  nucleic acid-binding Zn-ribbon protein